MNRRNFLQLAALAVAGQAAERVWPFRVYSIPKEIVLVPPPSIPSEIFDYVASVKHSVEMLTNGTYLHLGDTVGIYSGPDDFLRGTAKVERIQNGVITLDHVPAGCVPGDTIVHRPSPRIPFHLSSGDDFIGLRRS